MRSKEMGLWRHLEFRKLWAGRSISLMGSQVTSLALPLAAILMLAATPFEVGLLRAAGLAPIFLVGLFAGLLVDRMRRRPVLIAVDLGRALILGWVPVGALLGLLRIEHLYIVAFLSGILTVLFDTASMSFLPTLVPRGQLVEANSKLEMSLSVAQMAGPGLAGILVEVLTAPIAIVTDCMSFLCSALLLNRIRVEEPSPATSLAEPKLWREMREGLSAVLGSALLRPIALCLAVENLFGNVVLSVYVLYATRVLGLSPAIIGSVTALAGVGPLLGSLLAEWLPRRYGLGRTFIYSVFLYGLGFLIMSLAMGPKTVTVPTLLIGYGIFGFAGLIFRVNQVSLRQAITSDGMQGRVTASMRFITWGTMPFGSFVGGVLGSLIGERSTMLVGVCGIFLSSVFLIFSPIRALQKQPGSAGLKDKADDSEP